MFARDGEQFDRGPTQNHLARAPAGHVAADAARRADSANEGPIGNAIIGLCRVSLLYSIMINKFGIPPCVERHRVFVAKLWAM